jgi:hypothetical protein
MTDRSTATGKRTLWLLALRQRALWFRALKFGFTAGLLQAAVNQGDLWLRQTVSSATILKTIVSPVIGFTLVFLTSAGTWVQKSLEQNKT